MPGQRVPDSMAMADTAGARAGMYALLAGVFGHLPDMNLVARIKGRAFGELIEHFHAMKDKRVRAGVECLKSYLSTAESRPDGDILNELAVDRTRITRAPGNTGLKPPYEGLYKRDETMGSCAIKLKDFYRSTGFLPSEEVQEAPDYIGIELDFMFNLCQRESESWSAGKNAASAVSAQEEFLSDHLGSWVGEFCREAEKHATTEFYRGLLILLESLVSIDLKYLQELARKIK